jgi:hypothetical protein
LKAADFNKREIRTKSSLGEFRSEIVRVRAERPDVAVDAGFRSGITVRCVT